MYYRAVAQLVARVVWDDEAVSSSLTGPIMDIIMDTPTIQRSSYENLP